MVARVPWLDESWDFPVEVTAQPRAAGTSRIDVSGAIVVGSGPNGLAAAATLARAGVEVTVLEAAGEIGGGARSGELTVAGPAPRPLLGGAPDGRRAPPFCARWRSSATASSGAAPEVDLAHPLDDGSAGVMLRSLERDRGGPGGRRRAPGGGPSAARRARFAALNEDDLMRPVLHLPRHPLRLVRFGLPRGRAGDLARRALSARRRRGRSSAASRRTRSQPAQPPDELVGGDGAHLRVPRLRLARAPRAARGAITAALAAALAEHGGRIETGVPVRSPRRLAAADAVLLDLAPGAVAAHRRRPPARRGSPAPSAATGTARPPSRSTSRSRAACPWTNEACRRAGTVHVAGTFEEMVTAEREVNRGRMPDRPFVLRRPAVPRRPRALGRRRPPGVGLCPRAQRLRWRRDRGRDRPDRALRPGFRERIVATATRSPAEFEADNANYVGGDIITGANTARQILLRPRIALDPYATGVPGVYLCSAATPPGPGVHGMCGHNAARAALRDLGGGPL